MDNRKSVAEMIGEFMREAAVLAVVFLPLDVAIHGQGFNLNWLCVTAGVVVPTLSIGILIERRRPE